MRIAIPILLFLSLAAGQSKEPPKKARIEGSVVSLTGEPVPRAQLRLTGTSNTVDATPAGPVNVSTTSDDAGKFAFENIEPGRNYQLNAQRPGYVNTRYGARSPTAPGSPLTLDAGAELKGLVITMTPQGVISGKITDQSGDPVQGAMIAIARRGYQRGVRQLVPQNTYQTNDQGEYRAPNLPPGKYYVMAADRRVLDTALGGASPPGGRSGNISTFYPNATDPQAAVPLEITPGADLRGIDIRFRQGRMYSIRGKLDGAAAAGATNIAIQAMPKDAMTTGNTLAQLSQSGVAAASRAPDFVFEIRNLVPGTYVLLPRVQVTVNGTPTQRAGESVEVVIADQDVNGLVIPLGSGAPLTGTVAFEGGDVKTLATASGQNTALMAAAAAAGVILNAPGVRPSIALTPLGLLPTTIATSQISEDGKFRMEGVPQGRKYALTVNGLPAGSYVKSARFGGQDALRNGIELRGPGELSIVISNKAVDITGAVHTEGLSEDKAKNLGGLLVTLWSKDPEPGSTTNGVRTTYTDQNGGFQYRSLPPGEYFAAAWEEVDTGLVQNRDFLAVFTPEAAKVTLEEGAQGTIAAKLVPVDKIKAAEEKLP